MARTSLRVVPSVAVLVVLLAAGVSADDLPRPKEATHELKDSRGRVIRRVVFEPDGQLRTSTFIYQYDVLRESEDAHLDASRKPLRVVRDTFDGEGRMIEREESSVKNGKMVGTRTRIRYDAHGRRSEDKTPLE